MNLTFGISDNIKILLPQARLGVLYSKVKVTAASTQLDHVIKDVVESNKISLSEMPESKLTIIDETRKAYKMCGKEPSRYRPSAEALLRRIRTGKGLYRINNVVDTINLMSMSSHYSIGGFDYDHISGNVELDIGDANPYKAIGRGDLNIEHMPGVVDDLGFFGTPTSDSERTMVRNETKELVLVYYDFFGNEKLETALKQASEFLIDYCNGSDTAYEIVH